MGGYRVSDDKKQQIRELYANGGKISAIANRFGVSDGLVYQLTKNLSHNIIDDGAVAKSIPGLEDKYQVTSSGQVISLTKGGRAKEPKYYPSACGRKAVALSAYGEQIRVYVDELVATLFLGNGGADQRVIHIDGDWSNSSVDNLRWEDVPVVQKEYAKVVSADVVEAIRRDWLNGMKTIDICDRYGVSQSFVCKSTKDMLREIPAPISEPGEEWADVDGFEGRYLVSSHGRVYSTGCGRREPVMLKPHSETKGYQTVYLSGGRGVGRGKTVSVHRLVALAFCDGHSKKRDVVNHKDGNPSNNHADNLEWCTSKENTRHAIDVLGINMGGSAPFKRISTRVYPVDTNSARSALRQFSDEEVEFIRNDYHSSRQLAKMFGVNKCTIQRIRRGESYKDI